MRWGSIGILPAMLTAVGVAVAQPPESQPPTPLPPTVEQRIEPTPNANSVGEVLSVDPGAVPPSNQWIDRHQGPPEAGWFYAGYKYMWFENGPLAIPLAVSQGVTLTDCCLDFGTFTGGQFNGGLWLDRCHTTGIYFGGFMTEQRATISEFVSDGAGSPQITRPFFNVVPPMPSALVVSSPGTFAGAIVSDASAQLAGGQLGFAKNLYYTENYTVNLLFGFRYLDLDEDLSIVQSSTRIDGGTISVGGIPATGVVIEDRFHTRNQFYGGQVGGSAEYRWGPVVAGAWYLVALGTNQELVEIAGQSTAIGGVGGAVPSGFLALQGANVGRNTQSRFAVVPEVGVTLGWQVSQSLRFTAGYDFLYINDVARPGTQIDPAINQRLVPISPAFGSTSGPTFPVRTAADESFYAHGVTFGVEIKY
jgi:hypothetical protein